MAPRSFDGKIKSFEPTTTDEFSAKELSRSYWIVTHKVLFRNLFIIFLLTFDICFVSYSVYAFGAYLFAGAPREDALVTLMAQRLTQSSVDALKAAAPADISFGAAQNFDNGNGIVDFASEVQNPNASWYATVTYNFELGSPDNTTATTTVALLPNEHKYLLSLGNKNVAVSQVTLNVIDVSWRRVDAHQIPDPQTYIKDHATFAVTNANFTPQGVLVGNTIEANPGNQISFAITNQTGYNFYALPLQILLLRGGVVQAIEYTTVPDFRTNETRQMDLRNFTQGLTVDEVQVIPTVDVFDSSVYTAQ